ncbi:MAG: tyrosine-type recombinase/integrase [Sulfurospirillum sp.]
MILNNISKQYFNHVKVLHSERTYKTNFGYYNKHIKDTLGIKSIDTIAYLDVQLFVNALVSKEYKIKTVKNILTVLKNHFRFAKKLRLIDYDPTLDIELPKFDNTRYFNFSLEVQKDFINALINYNEPVYCDIFFFLLHGRRRSEVLCLTWDMVDLEQKLYYIPAKINKVRKNMQYMMTDPLYTRLYKIFLKECINQNTKYPKGYVFTNPNTQTRYKDLRGAWFRLLKCYNLPYIRLHDIRHLLGTYAINFLSLPIEHVSYALGHTNIEITQKYITIKPEISKSVISKVFDSLKDGEKV